MIATTRELANQNNLTYKQARYLIDQGVIRPKPAKKGQAWELNSNDLWILELAGILRNKKVSTKIIKEFTDQLQRYVEYYGDRADKEGFLLVFYGDSYQEAVSVFWAIGFNGSEWIVNTGKEAIQSLPNALDMAVEVLDNK